MKHFRLILSFLVCGWLVLVFDLFGRGCWRLSEDFASVALWIAGVKPE